jgi:collagenase-like PrtC family protease
MYRLSLGYNFDLGLLPALAALNAHPRAQGRITEIYGAIRGEGVRSARPQHKIPQLDWSDLATHVAEGRRHGLIFNYLLNSQKLASEAGLRKQAEVLQSCGVETVTVGTPKMARIVRDVAPGMRIVLSLTYRLRQSGDIGEAIAAGIDAAYLDAVTANRDFPLLRSLLASGLREARLYANVSCLSACPVIDAHYRAFDLKDELAGKAANERYFQGCSWVKAHSPVQWVQMPWIRPEDVPHYQAEGVSHFKLSDRMAPSGTLLRIAEAYVLGRSPRNLFSIIERDGAKFASVWEQETEHRQPFVASHQIPEDFIDHFRSGACRSRDIDCPYCNSVAVRAVRFAGVWPKAREDRAFIDTLPRALVNRVRSPRR